MPDLARILRDTLPPSPERRADPTPPTLERLIPGSAATSFLSHELVGSSSQGGLVQTIVAGTASVGAEAILAAHRLAGLANGWRPAVEFRSDHDCETRADESGSDEPQSRQPDDHSPDALTPLEL